MDAFSKSDRDVRSESIVASSRGSKYERTSERVG